MADPIETVKALDIDAIAREAGASTYTNRHAPGTAFAFGPDTWAAFKSALLSQMQALPEKGQADAAAQALGLYAAQADAIRILLDNHAPHTTGNLQTRVAAALAAQAERREPLSDASVTALIEQADGSEMSDSEFVRLIERAHGITRSTS